MPVTKERKADISKEFGKQSTDTGSPQVQIAILTERIRHLTDHLGENPKDYATRRGLIAMVGKRKALLDYLKTEIKPEDYKALLERLELRK